MYLLMKVHKKAIVTRAISNKKTIIFFGLNLGGLPSTKSKNLIKTSLGESKQILMELNKLAPSPPSSKLFATKAVVM